MPGAVLSWPAVRALAQQLGFHFVSYAPLPVCSTTRRRFAAWLRHNFHGEMDFMARYGAEREPQRVLAQVSSVIVVGLAYPWKPATEVAPDVAAAAATDPARPPRAIIARFAQGRDYHGVLKEKLAALASQIEQLAEAPLVARACADSAPLFERHLATQRGTAFTGKSTMAVVPGHGTHFVLGELLLNLPLAADDPSEPCGPQRVRRHSPCGNCRACMEHCPTGALVKPYVLDARRCIAYLTIEARGFIPHHLRPLMGQRVFGCDVCQEVCPHNAAGYRRPSAPQLQALARLQAPLLTELLHITSSAYKRLVGGTALARVSRQQLARNAAIALGNAGDPTTAESLSSALRSHSSPWVRGHAAWALGRLRSCTARAALQNALSREQHAEVAAEIALALQASAMAPAGQYLGQFGVEHNG